MAAGLGVRLSGPRTYGSDIKDDPWLNEQARDPHAHDITQGLALYRRTLVFTAALLLSAATIIFFLRSAS